LQNQHGCRALNKTGDSSLLQNFSDARVEFFAMGIDFFQSPLVNFIKGCTGSGCGNGISGIGSALHDICVQQPLHDIFFPPDGRNGESVPQSLGIGYQIGFYIKIFLSPALIVRYIKYAEALAFP